MARDTNPTLQNQIYIFPTAFDQDLTDTKTPILESKYFTSITMASRRIHKVIKIEYS